MGKKRQFSNTFVLSMFVVSVPFHQTRTVQSQSNDRVEDQQSIDSSGPQKGELKNRLRESKERSMAAQQQRQAVYAERQRQLMNRLNEAKVRRLADDQQKQDGNAQTQRDQNDAIQNVKERQRAADQQKQEDQRGLANAKDNANQKQVVNGDYELANTQKREPRTNQEQRYPNQQKQSVDAIQKDLANAEQRYADKQRQTEIQKDLNKASKQAENKQKAPSR